MHGSYRRAFGPENVVELHKNIIIQHEDYLKQDDADKKADALRYMAGYVAQYLHLVPQEKKFTFKETERLLHNSAMNIAEFDPREGHIAFRNLAKYAENLLEQPWRKDFHVIKLTSGFYVHNIAAQLQNAHEILIVMGYVNLDETTLKLIPNQNYANLKAVSRDCYVASQECLILSQIWQHVADQEPDYPLTIGEVFEYRKNHLGDTDTICNKLMYDIRARMHAVKQQQQQLHLHQHHHHQQQNQLIKNTQRFVPVDRLIDFDADDGSGANPHDEPDRPHHTFIPEREVERTQEHMKNVNLYNYNADDEHIYDPVYGGGDVPSVPVHGFQRKLSHPKPANNVQQQQPPPYFYNNNNSRKSVPAGPLSSYLQQQPPPQPQQFHHNNFTNNSTNNSTLLTMYSAGVGSDRESPMIPKTVTSLFSSNHLQTSRNNVSKSNSMNSINGGIARGANSSSSSSSMSHNFANQPLTRSKVKETDLDADMIVMSPRDALAPYLNNSSGGVNDNRNMMRTRKSMPGSIPPANNHANQVYPDQFYPPGIVKPVAVYGSPAGAPPPQQNYYQRSRLHSDNSEDVLNEAYAYASEVGQLPKGAQQQAYHHQATPIPPIHGSDSDERELNKRTGSSTDASSPWDGSVREVDYAARHQQTGNKILPRKSEPPKRPSHIDLRGNTIRHADSSPESDLVNKSKNKNGYRELSSSSSGGSPASPQQQSRNYPRNEDLSSLDTVYYDYLLKQGQTDEALGSGGSSGGGGGANELRANKKSNINNDHHQSSHRRQGSSSRLSSSQHHHHQQQQNNYSSGGEPEENHIYDGRRVVPKTHNDTVIRKKQNPVESAIPGSVSRKEPNYNLLGGDGDLSKPSHDKHLRKSSNYGSSNGSRSGGDRLPGESEDPSSVSPPPPPPKKVEPWDCRFCTFRNLVEERICEVCAKSKDFFEDLDTSPPVTVNGGGGEGQSSSSQGALLREQHIPIPKMYSVPNTSNHHPVVVAPHKALSTNGGGEQGEEEERECPQCTLLNPIRARVCDACGGRLLPVDSPKKHLEELPYDNR